MLEANKKDRASKDKPRTVILVNHPGSQKDDRASRLLAERGFNIQWVCPGDGEPLPEITEDLVGAVVYGGPQSVNDTNLDYLRDEVAWIESWLKTERPFFGICLGGQLLAQALGARVIPHPEGLHEIGYRLIEPTNGSDRFLDRPLNVYHWHNEGFEIASGAELLAVGSDFPNQAYRYGSTAYGIQFHPEVTPEVFLRWIDEAGHMLEHPGAHSAEQQIQDGGDHDGPLGEWLDDFLDHWIGYPEKT